MLDFDDGIAWLPPLAVATAILGAAVLLPLSRFAPRRLLNAVAVAAAGTVTTMAAIVLYHAAKGEVVTWAAGWVPVKGYSVGIVLVSDPVGAGAALVAGALTTLSLIFSGRYMEGSPPAYRPLMLLFLAGMAGFAFTADLFDMFVFFELMGASAYALTGMKVEDASALQGGFNFGVINSLGAYVSLMGLGILYARTGNVGLPQLHQDLAGRHPDALVITSFVLVLTGFMVKAALVPFHFWLADAHAVAPAPVCVLFSGIMVPLGVYAVFRVYWVVFSGTLSAHDVRYTFLALGALTAAIGAVMCLAQRHVKRLLAYSTIAHVGLFVCALALLDREGTAGALLYVAGHAGVKAALFLLAGLLLANTGSVDEHELYGVGRGTPIVPWLWVIAGLALAGMPPFGIALGKAVSEAAASASGDVWLVALFVAVSAMTAAAVLRVTARVFFGLGPLPSENAGQGATKGDEEPDSTFKGHPPTMLLTIAVLLAGALAEGILPSARSAAEHAAQFFIQPKAYAGAALFRTPATALAPRTPNWDAGGLLLGFLSTGLALGLAAAGLYTGVLLEKLGTIGRMGAKSMSALRDLHSGHIGDYVAWLAVGVALVLVLLGTPAALAG